MYRDGKTYDEIDKVIIDIYNDYNIHKLNQITHPVRDLVQY